MQQYIVPIFSFVTSLFFVILFIALGWYAVWTLFLKKFKFVRELLGTNGPEGDSGERPRRSRAKTRKD